MEANAYVLLPTIACYSILSSQMLLLILSHQGPGAAYAPAWALPPSQAVNTQTSGSK